VEGEKDTEAKAVATDTEESRIPGVTDTRSPCVLSEEMTPHGASPPRSRSPTPKRQPRTPTKPPSWYQESADPELGTLFDSDAVIDARMLDKSWLCLECMQVGGGSDQSSGHAVRHLIDYNAAVCTRSNPDVSVPEGYQIPPHRPSCPAHTWSIRW
jgi:hypothetical protein